MITHSGSKRNGAALVDGKQLKSLREIMSESGINGLWIMFRLELSFIDANELLSFAGLLAETIVGDPVKPGRKTRLAPEAAKIFVSAQKRFLRQIVRERDIGADELAEQTSDARLMISHQFGEGMVVIIEKNSGDEVCIRKRHGRMLGQRRDFVFRSFKLPNDQISEADQERNDADCPGAAIPVVHRAEEDHQAETNHHQDDSAAHIRTRTDDRRRRKEGRGDWLTFFHHGPDGAMQGTRFQVTEEHDRRDDHDRRRRAS